MTIHLTRRAFIPQLALGAVGFSSLCRSVMAAERDITVANIADKLTLFSGAGGNVVVHEAPDSIVLIDGGAPEHASALLAAVAQRFGDKPIAALVNTHWHWEQTGANDTLGARGVPIIAHENTKRWMTTRIEQKWNGAVFKPRASVALPTRTFYLHDELKHGSETIALAYTPRAHTDGDIHAYFPSANVIVAGGIAYAGTYPIFDTATNGWIGEMLDATRTLIKRANASTIIVPADGGVLTIDHLKAQEGMLATILERFQKLSAKGKGGDEMLKEGIAAEFVNDWGDPTEFILSAWEGLGDHMKGLGAF
jgi:glyoxylase-like metal-dependent hydrolase (beta-lactamase superfamily II)